MFTSLIAASVLLAAQEPAAAEPDWGALLRADAEAIHATLTDSHPGVHDALNPGFMQTLNDGRDLALQRADTARDVNGYWWALREYVASFNDGHTQLGPTQALPNLPADWPGFATAYQQGAHRVVANSEATDPPVGAALVSCDGIDADRLAEQNVGRFRGLWTLQTARIAFGAQLFRQTGNPYLHRPRNCLFEAEGQTRAYDLTWRPFDEASGARISGAVTAASARAREPIGIRPFGPNGFWITVSDFNSGTETAQANTALIEAMTAMAPALRNAERIVYDLRGNNGGSSHWSKEMARALWGKDYVDARSPGADSVDWRASDANIAHFAELRDRFESGAEMYGWLAQVVTGMQGARDRGEPLWTERDAEPEVQEVQAPLGETSVRGRVYVLTDYYCASACLDAVDVWLLAGGVHIGQETAADSLYMDIRVQPLPSGFGQLVVPTKVYRGRMRGSNESLKPRHPYDGAMTDTAALEQWVQTLP